MRFDASLRRSKTSTENGKSARLQNEEGNTNKSRGYGNNCRAEDRGATLKPYVNNGGERPQPVVIRRAVRPTRSNKVRKNGEDGRLSHATSVTGATATVAATPTANGQRQRRQKDAGLKRKAGATRATATSTGGEKWRADSFTLLSARARDATFKFADTATNYVNSDRKMPRFPVKSTGTQKAWKTAALHSNLLRNRRPFGVASTRLRRGQQRRRDARL